jgi:alkylation response protein AidB-like acyl-CoA dehydrogenase
MVTTMTLTGNSSTTSTATDWTERAGTVGADLRAAVREQDTSGQLSLAAIEQLRAAGLTGALVPTEFGGGGASHVEMGDILREIARHDPATAVTLSMHSHLVAAQVWRHHHGLDAEKMLRKVGEDRAVLVSTGASDWVASNGNVRKVDGGFRASARKGPASGCEAGNILVTSLRWDDAPDGPQVLHCAVPFDADGVSIDLTWDTLGLRATGSHTVVLDDVFVPDAAIALARPADQWHPVWNTVVGVALPLIMSAYVGIADSAVELARAAVSGRSEPHVFQLLGEMINAHTTATDLVAAMFADSDNLQFANTDELASRTLSRKTVATDALIDTVRLAIEVTGGVGYTRSSDIERLYRDVHGCLFHPLPRAKQTHLTGRVALGLSPIA